MIDYSFFKDGMGMRKGNTILICLFFTVLIGCSRQSKQAQGYIEGEYTYMATSVSGALLSYVPRGTMVKKGQVVFTLQEEPESDAYQAAIENLNQSIASRASIIANLTYAKLTFERNKILVPQKAIQQSELDNARANYESLLAQLSQAEANIASSRATLAQAAWNKNQKVAYAPTDAVVFDTYYRVGEYTVANQAVLALLAPQDIKAVFYVNETVLGGLRVNDKVSVQCDGCSKNYMGHITFISPSAEYTPPVIYSTETNDKLIYRIEARFSPQDAFHLHPGQPVEVTYTPRA